MAAVYNEKKESPFIRLWMNDMVIVEGAGLSSPFCLCRHSTNDNQIRLSDKMRRTAPGVQGEGPHWGNVTGLLSCSPTRDIGSSDETTAACHGVAWPETKRIEGEGKRFVLCLGL